MDLQLDETQAQVVSGVQAILQHYRDLPTAHRRDRSYYALELDDALGRNGYLDIARTEGMGALEAALVMMEAATVPAAVETGASMLVAPHLSPDVIPRPITVVSGDLMKAQRYLPVARTALIDVGDDVLVLPVDPANVEAVETIYAYPFGRFMSRPDLSKAVRLGPGAVAPLRQWWRTAIAAESAGLMRAAVDFIVDYVKQRRMFGTTLAAYQVVHHRLAECHLMTEGVRALALKAAWSGEAFDAYQAASYAQQCFQKVLFDTHQFNGGMGVTNENKLHFWTYRFRALQAEAGGVNAAALDTAELLWGPPSTPQVDRTAVRLPVGA
jgi:alkylation response protein AidB-like acyl-CoA dehydrogenase